MSNVQFIVWSAEESCEGGETHADIIGLVFATVFLITLFIDCDGSPQCLLLRLFTTEI